MAIDKEKNQQGCGISNQRRKEFSKWVSHQCQITQRCVS